MTGLDASVMAKTMQYEAGHEEEDDVRPEHRPVGEWILQIWVKI
jgi:hypothetical protein